MQGLEKDLMRQERWISVNRLKNSVPVACIARTVCKIDQRAHIVVTGSFDMHQSMIFVLNKGRLHDKAVRIHWHNHVVSSNQGTVDSILWEDGGRCWITYVSRMLIISISERGRSLKAGGVYRVVLLRTQKPRGGDCRSRNSPKELRYCPLRPNSANEPPCIVRA